MSEIQVYQTQLPAKAEHFVTAFTPQKCLVQFGKITTPALCLDSKTPSLAKIKKQYSEDFILAYIELWLDNLNDYINATRKLNVPQMQEIAILILQDYYYFNLADINLVFRKIKRGEFGKLFESLDGTKILSWFDEYAAQRIDTAIDRNEAQSNNYKIESKQEDLTALNAKAQLKKQANK